MDASIEKDLVRFIRVWAIGVPAMVLLPAVAVLFAWPDRWLAWVIFLLALLFGYMTHRQTRVAARALSSVRSGPPESCMVELRVEPGDGRDYLVGRMRRSPGEEWTIRFASPSWDAGPLLHKGVLARAFIEADSGYPLVVITDRGGLWAERIPTRIEAGG